MKNVFDVYRSGYIGNRQESDEPAEGHLITAAAPVEIPAERFAIMGEPVFEREILPDEDAPEGLFPTEVEGTQREVLDNDEVPALLPKGVE